MSESTQAASWGNRLKQLGHVVRAHLHRMLGTSEDNPALPVAEEGGDTIYAVDRYVEPIIERVIQDWPDDLKPLLLIAEGMGNDGRLRFGPQDEPLKYRLIVDPIDGTRNLMYDKRSAWFLAAVAPERGEDTRLRDSLAAVMVELPTSKQSWCDTFVGGVGQQTTGSRCRIDDTEEFEVIARPSSAVTLKDGFAQVTNFFPGTKVLASELMERIAVRTLGEVRPGRADVFDDQYLTTGGQMVELMLGHDRFCCDLRPLFYGILERQSEQTVRGLECHPYDAAGALVAQNAGVILTDGFGGPLDSPLNVTYGVHWCGYANEALQEIIQPVIIEWLAEYGVHATTDTD